jgi:transposase
MTPEKMFHEMLGLGMNWEVKESRFERESGTVFLEIQERAELWQGLRCPKDGGEVFCYDHAEEMTWRHLNVFQHRCEITCRLPRGKCRQCGHLFRVRPPWEGLSTHFSKEFEAFALLLMREMPVSKGSIGRREGHPVMAHAHAACESGVCGGGLQPGVLHWGG